MTETSRYRLRLTPVLAVFVAIITSGADRCGSYADEASGINLVSFNNGAGEACRSSTCLSNPHCGWLGGHEPLFDWRPGQQMSRLYHQAISSSASGGLLGSWCGWRSGGWLQLGYHDASNGLFNNRPHEVQVQQAWLYAERAADGGNGWGFGGRIDALYGTDAQNTQAFGTDPSGWDNPWDNGGANGYGWAMPQLYGDAAYGDLSIRAGHFFTIVGYEVVSAPDNFFYSHAFTFNNSEPFTHTGLLATIDLSDRVAIYGGYTLGWDSGFSDNGDAFLGGFSAGLTRDLTMTYATTMGRFNENFLANNVTVAERGEMHSLVFDYAVSDRLNYVFQTDYLDTEDGGGQNVRDTEGINQYLLYSLNRQWVLGGRFEWWNVENAGQVEDSDVYSLTVGLNYRPHANVVIRPEIRFDWDSDQVLNLNNNYEENLTTVGIDTVLTF